MPIAILFFQRVPAFQAVAPEYLKQIAEVQSQEGRLGVPRAISVVVADIQAGRLQDNPRQD